MRRRLIPLQWRYQLERLKVPEVLLFLGVAVFACAGIAEPGTHERIWLFSVGFAIGLCGMLLLRRP